MSFVLRCYVIRAQALLFARTLIVCYALVLAAVADAVLAATAAATCAGS